MKSIITIALSLMISFGAIAQTYITQAKPYGEKLWGYLNDKGEMIIAPVYKKCYKFSENGLAPIYESKKFQFINTKGEKFATDVEGFTLIQGFVGIGGVQGYSSGLVAIQKNKSWGFLNSKGAVAVMLKFEKVSSFNNGSAIAKSGTNFFVIDKTGSEIKIEIDNLVNVKSFSEGLASFSDNTKNFGFIDNTGQIAIFPQFVAVGYFNAGLAWAKTNDKKVGFIGKDGKWVIEPQFISAKNFDAVSGLARIKTEEGWAYTDKEGLIIKVTISESWGDFSEGLAKGKKEGKTGYYNAKGEWAISPEFEGGRDFKNGYAAVKKGGKWGFIDKTGIWVIEPNYAVVKDMELVK